VTPQESIARRRDQAAIPTPQLLLGDSGEMKRLREDVAAAGRCDANVLMVGEPGVGKEIIARLIHATGRRRLRSFVTINCTGVPDSLLESELFGHARGSFTGAYRDKPGLTTTAHEGTLFLDEVGGISLRMQTLLLRFAESGDVTPVGSDRTDRRVNVRIVGSTSDSLAPRIAIGEFREDLYYRLNVIRLRIPALRERAGDIAALLHHYLIECATAHSVEPPRFSEAAERMLTLYRWPGNVRELKTIVERVVLRHAGREVLPEDLPTEIRDSLGFRAR
jgi:DNA-binding NtrC family response regulator